jgi:hypothetical protein
LRAFPAEAASQAKGGTATHPMTLQPAFMFQGDTLYTFAARPRALE